MPSRPSRAECREGGSLLTGSGRLRRRRRRRARAMPAGESSTTPAPPSGRPPQDESSLPFLSRRRRPRRFSTGFAVSHLLVEGRTRRGRLPSGSRPWRAPRAASGPRLNRGVHRFDRLEVLFSVRCGVSSEPRPTTAQFCGSSPRAWCRRSGASRRIVCLVGTALPPPAMSVPSRSKMTPSRAAWLLQITFRDGAVHRDFVASAGEGYFIGATPCGRSASRRREFAQKKHSLESRRRSRRADASHTPPRGAAPPPRALHAAAARGRRLRDPRRRARLKGPQEGVRPAR